jgi:hypothetical protein
MAMLKIKISLNWRCFSRLQQYKDSISLQDDPNIAELIKFIEKKGLE